MQKIDTDCKLPSCTSRDVAPLSVKQNPSTIYVHQKDLEMKNNIDSGIKSPVLLNLNFKH